MIREQYAARMAAGLCVGHGSCRRKRVPGARMCRRCREVQRAAARRCAARAYETRKAAGLCVQRGCDQLAGDTVLCRKHLDAQARRAAAYHALPRVKAEKAAHARRYREERREAGLCLSCNQPSVGGRWCLVHLRKHGAKAAERRRAKGMAASPNHCGICGEQGHRRETCQARLLSLGIEHYATARPES